MASVVSTIPDPPKAAEPWPRSWVAGVFLVAVIFAVYANALRAPFLFDDSGAVLENATIRKLTSSAVLNPPNDGSTTTGRPIVNLSFAINYAVSKENTWSYHALNVAIHALAALVLLGLVRRLLAEPRVGVSVGGAAATLAFLIALIWALHPLQTETVVCIAQRTESLCGLFYFLTLYGFIRGAGPRASRAWFGVSVVACLLGMATKEVMVTAPLMVLLYDRFFQSGAFSAAWRQRRGYYFALGSTWLLLAWLVLHRGGARGGAAGFGLGVSWWSYLLKQADAIALYLKLSLWPHPLILDYGSSVVQSVVEVWWQGLLVLVLLGTTIWALVRKSALGFAGAWFFLILSPSSSVVPLVTQTVAEHRMYLPLAAVVTLGACGLYRYFAQRAVWLLSVFALGFAWLTVVRNQDYRDPAVIWADTVAKRPENARAHNNLAWVLQRQGKSDEANEHFARALELQPNYVTGHYNWGVALLDQHRVPEAIAQFQAAVRLEPNHADAYLFLGNALMQVQRPAEAVVAYEAARRIGPGPDVDYNLGVALMAIDRDAEARTYFQAALRENPALVEAHYCLGRIADLAGRFAEAEAAYNETLQLNPEHAGAHARLGQLLARSDRLIAAADHLQTAVRLSPTDPDARASLGTVYLLQGRPREAVACYEESLRLRPNDPRTLENLQLAREALH
jgi:tetratricopeptide (TPR) repeat protein